MEDTTASRQMDRDAEDVRSESAGLNETRRGFLKGALAVGGMAASWGAAGALSPA